MVVIRDEQPLPRRAFPATLLKAKRRPVSAESRAEFDAEGGVEELNLCGAGVKDELLDRRIGLTSGTVMVDTSC